jgi:hypothetical protein
VNQCGRILLRTIVTVEVLSIVAVSICALLVAVSICALLVASIRHLYDGETHTGTDCLEL